MYTFKCSQKRQQQQQQLYGKEEEEQAFSHNNTGANAVEGTVTVAQSSCEYGDGDYFAEAQLLPENTNLFDTCETATDVVNIDANENNTAGADQNVVEGGGGGGGFLTEPCQQQQLPTPAGEEEQQMGVPVGQLLEEMPAEEVLGYCRKMIVYRNITPPPQWRRMRLDLPKSIAELRLTPSAPEPIQEVHPITPSSCVVLQLDNCVPEGMTTNEYAKSLVKYVMDLLAFQRASTAITSLRFVKIGTELSQLVLTFGRDVQLASLMLREFTKVNLRAGFGTAITKHTPNATFRVVDYNMTLHNGSGITAEDVTALLEPVRPPLNINVLPGYEPGLFYAAVKRAEVVYAWLWNPFCSFLVQRTLFERCGVLVTMADCPHEFVSRGGGISRGFLGLSLQKKKQQQLRGKWNSNSNGNSNNNNNGNYINNNGLMNSDDDDDADGDSNTDDNSNNVDDSDNFEMNDAGDDVWLGGDRHAKGSTLDWSRNAKEEIDIFGGLKQTAHVDLLDDDITMLLRNPNTEIEEQQKQQPTHQQQQQPEYCAPSQFDPPINHFTTEAMLPAPFAHSAGLQHHQSLYPYNIDAPVSNIWQEEQAQQPQQQQFMYNTQIVTQEMPPYGVAAPLFQPVCASVQSSSMTKYPELVDENSNNIAFQEHATSKQNVPQAALTQEQQQEFCWNFGSCNTVSAGSFYQSASFPSYSLHHQFAPHINLPHESQSVAAGVSAAPSILGQPACGTLFMAAGEFAPGADISINTSNNDSAGGAGILVSPSITPGVLMPQPRKITVHRASELARRLVELTQLIFYTPKEGVDLNVTLPVAVPESADDSSSSFRALFRNVPCTAAVPRMSAEMDEFMQFLEEQHFDIKEVIKSSSLDFQDSRRQIVSALLSCNPSINNGEENDWKVQEQDEQKDVESIQTDNDNGNTGYVASTGVNKPKTSQLPALLPYLLTSIEGTEIVSAIASHHTALLLPLLARYALPFLLDASVVQSIYAVALRADPTAENPIVQRILRHWEELTAWLHAYIQCHAAFVENKMEGEFEQHTSTQSLPKFAKNLMAVRRLTSQVGNTMDMLLESMSPEQRVAIRTYLDATRPLNSFIKKMQAVQQAEATAQDDKQQQQEEISSTFNVSVPLLWSADGAVHRSLLRLYLNANLFDGSHVVNVLFASQPFLTRDHYYFLLIAFSKSLISPVLGNETARACGAFLRLMEQKQLNTDNDESSSHVLTKKDAEHLLYTALRALGSLEAYTCLREAYFASPLPVRRYEQVEAKLSRPTPPLNLSLTSSLPAQDKQHTEQETADGQKSFAKGKWQQKWTAAMRNYPPIGEPFTPLPIGWTSALSRSYGHYYFKNSKGTATYKHPTDAAEFMASPQAFLREPGVSVTLADVLAFANHKHEKTEGNEGMKTEITTTSSNEGGQATVCGDDNSGITEAVAENWLQDQRMRVEELDVATLELLKITYRAGQRGGQSRSRRSSRHRRESSERRRHHSRHHKHHSNLADGSSAFSCHNSSHNSHQSRKRPRSTSCSAAELQRRLSKLRGYPARGHPFPPLPRGWTCNLSSSNGLYYFRPPRGNPIYKHPQSHREYRATPQAFIMHRGIQTNALAVGANKTVEEVEKWLCDQLRRDEVLDAVAARMVPIEYAFSPDCDDDERDNGDETAVEERRRQDLEERNSRLGAIPRKSHGKK